MVGPGLQQPATRPICRGQQRGLSRHRRPVRPSSDPFIARARELESETHAKGNIGIRQAKLEDIGTISRLCAEVFGVDALPTGGSTLMQIALQSYGSAAEQEVKAKLEAALTGKQQAALAARQYRFQREAALLRAQLAAARGERAVFPTEGPAELRQLSKWQVARRFVCLVAVQQQEQQQILQPLEKEADSGASSSSSSTALLAQGTVVGCVMLNMMQPEAQLPPPFPSNAPWRPYISNMAVAASVRRQGVARALLQRAERIAAAAWGEPSLWLHVSTTNQAARSLYLSSGFVPLHKQRLTLTPGSWQEDLLCKDLAATAAAAAAAAAGVGAGKPGRAVQTPAGGVGSAGSEREGPSSSAGQPGSAGVYRWSLLEQQQLDGQEQNGDSVGSRRAQLEQELLRLRAMEEESNRS